MNVINFLVGALCLRGSFFSGRTELNSSEGAHLSLQSLDLARGELVEAGIERVVHEVV